MYNIVNFHFEYCLRVVRHAPGGKAYDMPEAYVIASGKGGTGKTTVTAGIGCALGLLGFRCLCIDADVGIRSLDLTLGAHDRGVFDFYDVYTGRASLWDAAITPPLCENLRILTAPLTIPLSDIPPDALTRVVQTAADTGDYDYIFLDCPAGLGPLFEMTADAAQFGIVVATPDPISLRCADRTAEALLRHGIREVRMVVNRVRPRMMRRQTMPNIDDAMDMARLPLLGYVPEDEFVIACQIAGRPVSSKRYNRVARAFDDIAHRISGDAVSVHP